MKEFRGKALRWEWREGVVELTLDHEPLNEIGTVMLADLEKFAASIKKLASVTSACIITSARAGWLLRGGGSEGVVLPGRTAAESAARGGSAGVPEAYSQSVERD